MKSRRNSKRVMIAALGTAALMAGIGGTTALAGSGSGAKDHKAFGGPMHGPGDRAAFVTALAGKLGVTTDALTAALQSLRPTEGTRPDRAAFPQALADKLSLDVAAVQAALDSVRPPMGPDGHAGPGGPDGDGGPGGHMGHGPRSPEFAAALATALGLTADQVNAAFASIPKPAAGTRPARGTLVTALASALGIDAATLKTAMHSVRADRRAAAAPGLSAKQKAAVRKAVARHSAAVKAAAKKAAAKR